MYNYHIFYSWKTWLIFLISVLPRWEDDDIKMIASLLSIHLKSGANVPVSDLYQNWIENFSLISHFKHNWVQYSSLSPSLVEKSYYIFWKRATIHYFRFQRFPHGPQYKREILHHHSQRISSPSYENTNTLFLFKNIKGAWKIELQKLGIIVICITHLHFFEDWILVVRLNTKTLCYLLLPILQYYMLELSDYAIEMIIN